MALSGKPFAYCPGCMHGTLNRIVAEVIDELGILERTVGISPVGCAVFMHEYFNCDFVQAAHGRAPAVATGIKRSRPGNIVFTYQGDGDLAAIGMGEIVHAAARGEKITVVFVNNATYGMTGGQQAPTTLPGQKTATTPAGRNVEAQGYPIRVCEMLAALDGPAYIARVAAVNPMQIGKVKAAIKRAFQAQVNGEGFALVEVLSTCPVQWKMTPLEAMRWAESHMMAYYPLGVFRDCMQGAAPDMPLSAAG